MLLRALLSQPSSLSINVAHPIATRTIPPPTCTTGSEIPKKARMYVPTKYEPTNSTKLSTAIRHDNAFRASELYPPVRARKNGLPPIGSTIGKIALRIRSRFFAASSIALDFTPPACQGLYLVLPSHFRKSQALLAAIKPSANKLAPLYRREQSVPIFDSRHACLAAYNSEMSGGSPLAP